MREGGGEGERERKKERERERERKREKERERIFGSNYIFGSALHYQKQIRKKIVFP